MDKQLHRTHPLTILVYLWRFLFLLIVPLLRGFLSAFGGDLISWALGAWLDLLVLAVIIFLACLMWYRSEYKIDKKRLYYTSGILFRRTGSIPMHRISTLSTVQPFWLRPFRVVKLRVETISKNAQKADITLYLSEQQAHEAMELRAPAQGAPMQKYRTSPLGVAFLSLFTSNTFFGVILISTFVSQAGKLLGNELPRLLLYTFEQTARKLAFGLLPPLAAYIALALLLGWVVAFCVNLLQTKNLYTMRSEKMLYISGGVLAKKAYSLLADDISFVDIRQSMVTKLLRLYSVFINAVGFGKERSDITALIPFSRQDKTYKNLKKILPEYMPQKPTLRPNPRRVFPFLLLPATLLFFIFLLTETFCRIFPYWETILRFSSLFMYAPAIWFLAVRFIALFTSGLSYRNRYYTFCYSRRFYLHTVVVSSAHISAIEVRQNPFQRRSGLCTLYIYNRAEKRTVHILRGLSKNACLAMFEISDA